MERGNAAYRAATLYYGENRTMDAIARMMDVSRPTVSRLLQYAREAGIVSVNLFPPTRTAKGLEREIRDAYGVEATVVEVDLIGSDSDRRAHSAAAAARFIERQMGPGVVLGVSWGTMTDLIAKSLVKTPVRGSQIVQLNGSSNTVENGRGAESILARFGAAFESSVTYFPVPAFFDDPATRAAMWREHSIVRILNLQRTANIALFGVGSVQAGVPSPVYSARYLSDEDRRSLDDAGVVGDVCTVFLRDDGTYDGIAMNDRTTGLRPAALRGIAIRVCVVSGSDKTVAVRAALRAGLATHLIIDSITAGALVDLDVSEVGSATYA